MADSAALLVDDVLPSQPMRQWVLSVPFPLRFLFASNPKAMTGVLGIVYRAISTHLSHKAGLTKPTAQKCMVYTSFLLKAEGKIREVSEGP